MGAIREAVSGGLSSFEASHVVNAMAKAAVSNAVSQGVGVVLGVRESFSWRSVAASAVGAGVGYIPPAEFEANYHQQRAGQAATV